VTFVAIGSAFLVGLLGEVHCVGMCGGIAAVACGGQGARRSALVHAGRLSAYGVQGAIVGAIGAAVTGLAPVHAAQVVVRLFAGLALVAVGLHLAGVASPLAPVERLLAAPLGRARAWLASRSSVGPAGELARGVAWGLLPCGLVQGALALSLAMGSPGWGAVSMLAFGLGTVPALVAVSALARGALSLATRPRARRAAGVLVLASGVVHLAMAAIDLDLVRLDDAERPCCAGKHAG
jgi:sulfite exporter TauE/SafE